MLAKPAARTALVLSLIAAPLLAQSGLPGYGPSNAKYRITTSAKTSQVVMGTPQDFESTANQLVSLAVQKAGDAFALTMTLDSAVMTTTAPGQSTDPGDAIGMKLSGRMTPDGKVTASEVTAKAGGTPTSPLAANMRSFLPRLKLGATKGSTWVDSVTYAGKSGNSDVTTTTVATSLAGDTTVAEQKAWKIISTSASTVTGVGIQMGSAYTLEGNVKGQGIAVLSAGGVLLGITSNSETRINVVVAAANMTIPITTTQTARIDKLP